MHRRPALQHRRLPGRSLPFRAGRGPASALRAHDLPHRSSILRRSASTPLGQVPSWPATTTRIPSSTLSLDHPRRQTRERRLDSGIHHLLRVILSSDHRDEPPEVSQRRRLDTGHSPTRAVASGVTRCRSRCCGALFGCRVNGGVALSMIPNRCCGRSSGCCVPAVGCPSSSTFAPGRRGRPDGRTGRPSRGAGSRRAATASVPRSSRSRNAGRARRGPGIVVAGNAADRPPADHGHGHQGGIRPEPRRTAAGIARPCVR